MSFSTDIVFEWILKMCARPSRSGSPNSIFRSSRPGRVRAGSRVSGRFVGIKTIQLIDQLQHSPLNLIITTCSVIKPCTSDSIDLIKKNYTRFLASSHLKKLPHHPSTFTNVLLNQL